MSAIEPLRPRIGELQAAFGLLTRLRLPRLGVAMPDAVSDAVWAFPIVGGVIGVIGAIVYWLSSLIACPPLLAALFALAAMVLATGALHEDGLADCADGLGGNSPEKRLAIMRDHVIGSYGTLALILAVGARIAAIAALGTPSLVASGLIAAGAVSRLAPVLIMASLPHARSDGLSVSVGRPGNGAVAAGVLIAFAIALIEQAFLGAVLIMLLAAILARGLGLYAKARLGGQTGDVLGASAVLTEIAALTALVCLNG